MKAKRNRHKGHQDVDELSRQKDDLGLRFFRLEIFSLNGRKTKFGGFFSLSKCVTVLYMNLTLYYCNKDNHVSISSSPEMLKTEY